MRGLSEKNFLGDFDGMLFIFPVPQYAFMGMENTSIPLDILWLTDTLEINQIKHNAKPYRSKVFSSRKRSSYVLEINGGTCKYYGIKEGSRGILIRNPS